MYNRLLRQKVRTALVYADTKTISPGLGNAKHTFRLNSIQDPDFTGIGHHPAFHDKWSLLYAKYRVIKTSWHIVFANHRGALFDTVAVPASTFCDTSAYDQQRCGGIVGFEVSDDSTLKHFQTVDANIIREIGWQNKVKYKMMNSNPNSSVSLSGSMSPKQYLDDPNDADESVLFHTNPVPVGHLHVCALSKDGGPMSDIRFDIRLTYVVELTDPIAVEEEN